MGGLIGSDFLTKVNPVGTGSLSLNGMAESDSGAFSVELGENTNAQGRASMAVGSNTVATAEDSFVCGRYNIIDQDNTVIFNTEKNPELEDSPFASHRFNVIRNKKKYRLNAYTSSSMST